MSPTITTGVSRLGAALVGVVLVIGVGVLYRAEQGSEEKKRTTLSVVG